MNKTLKWTLIFGGIASAGVVGYHLYQNGKDKLKKAASVSKEDQVNKIILSGNGSGPASNLMALDETYIQSWYNAVITNNTSFTIGSNTFSTKGGRAIASNGNAQVQTTAPKKEDDFTFWDTVKVSLFGIK